MKNRNKTKLRYNLTTALVYIIGIVLLMRLFDLQIINGKKYREESNTRLTRETTLKAARGSILASGGEKLVSTTIQHNVEIYKTKISTEALNSTLLLFAQTLEENSDSYIDDFPIAVNPYSFKEGTNAETWKKSNKIDSNMSEEDIFNKYKNKYQVTE